MKQNSTGSCDSATLSSSRGKWVGQASQNWSRTCALPLEEKEAQEGKEGVFLLGNPGSFAGGLCSTGTSRQEPAARGESPPGGAIELMLRSPVGGAAWPSGLLGVLGKPLENTGLPATKWVGTASGCNPGEHCACNSVRTARLGDTHHVALSAFQAGLDFLCCSPGAFLQLCRPRSDAGHEGGPLEHVGCESMQADVIFHSG